jgi:FAD/FMN-containing dehydrogenase
MVTWLTPELWLTRAGPWYGMPPRGSFADVMPARTLPCSRRDQWTTEEELVTGTTPDVDVQSLRDRLSGTVVAPGETDWDAARRAWNLVPDQRPVAVAFPHNREDVVAIIEFARAQGLKAAPQATGHFAGPLGPLEDAILVKTSRLRGAEVDARTRRARVQAGAQWMDVTVPAAEHGLAALAGTAPDVGIVGYTVGGGLSWLGRRYGFAANSVTAAELVTAEGETVRADSENEPDLFWAIRGGGGSFGIVTELEFRLFPVAELYAGDLFWPFERASEILHAWREWVDTVPVELTSVGRLLQLPPLPEIPEPFRGRSFVVVEAAHIGTEAEGQELLRPLRELEPELDTLATIQPPGLEALHMDPPEPVGGIGDGALLDTLPGKAVDALAEVAGPGSGSPLLSVEVRHLGGALSEPSPDHGAVGSVQAGFAMFAVGIAVDAETAAAADAHVKRVRETLRPWESGRTYFNFTERRVETHGLFSSEAVDRLRQIKHRFDPGELFRVCHPVSPA